MCLYTTDLVKHSDGYCTKLYYYAQKENNSKGLILIIHGMCEHHQRYLPFTELLNEHGYDVCLYDHRGHGKEVRPNNLGYVAKHHGNDLLVQDGIDIINKLKEKNPKELIILSHSMGSLIGRNIIQTCNKMDRAIFMGTACPSQITCLSGMLLTSIILKLKGARHHSRFLQKLMFESGPYKKVNKQTNFDWITRDKKMLQLYMEDPLCGFPPTVAFLHDITALTYTAGQKKRIHQTNHSLPILFMSGAMDPVGNCSKGVLRIYRRFIKSHFTSVSIKIYPGCHHELLNEVNRKEIMSDLISYLDGSKAF